MATLERIYTIPLGGAYATVRNKRGKRAVLLIRDFTLRHMKAKGVKISEGVNSAVLRDGIQKPPRRIKVRIAKGDEGVAKVWLLGEEEKLKEIAERKKKEDEAKKKEEKTPEAKKEAAKPAATAPSAPSKPAPSGQAAPQKPATQPAAQKPAAAPSAQAVKK